jgi:hypothetical protein
MTTTTAAGSGLKRNVGVLIGLLAVTALQFFIGYGNLKGSQLVVRFVTFAIIETILVVLFLMNLGLEKRLFVKFVAFFMLFVLFAMNYIWTDSFRLLMFRLTGNGPS